jgi:hypothetical protein
MHRSWKQLPAAKNVFVPMIWWITTTFPQSMYYGETASHIVSSMVGYSGLFVLTWTASVVLLNDIPDMDGMTRASRFEFIILLFYFIVLFAIIW